MTSGLPRVYRWSLAARVIVCLIMLTYTAYAIYALCDWFVGGFRNSSLADVLALAGFAAGLDWLFYAMFLRTRVVLTADTLEIRNGRSIQRIPLAEVVDARPGPNGTAFVLVDGSYVGSTALQKGLGAQLLHVQTRADRAVQEILAAARARRGLGEPDREPGAAITPAYGQGMAVASLVAGIAGLLASWIFGLNLVLAVLATVLGVFALDRANRGVAPGKRAALAGLVCGLTALVLSIVFMFVLYET